MKGENDFISIVRKKTSDGKVFCAITNRVDLDEDELSEIRIGNVQLKNSDDKVYVTLFEMAGKELNLQRDSVEGTIEFEVEK